jgi:hypothetical protein
MREDAPKKYETAYIILQCGEYKRTEVSRKDESE